MTQVLPPRRSRARVPGIPQSSLPEFVRERCRRTFYDHIHVAEQILDSPKSDGLLKLKALDVLGKYGLGYKTESETTTRTVDAAAIMAALRDPAVRAWLDTRPDLKQKLLAPGASGPTEPEAP